MTKLLDLFAYCAGLTACITFAIIWVILVTCYIADKSALNWNVFHLKWWVGATVVALALTLSAGRIVRNNARHELKTISESHHPLNAIIYSEHCIKYLGKGFITLLVSSNDEWPTGSRFVRKRYKAAILSSDTVARLQLVQNDFDSTLYCVYYPKYLTTESNQIGVIRIAPSLLQQCK